MAEITLVAEAGRPHGSPASRRLRSEGKVPAVLYGHGMVPVALAVEARELRNALRPRRARTPSSGWRSARRTTWRSPAKSQRHPLRHTITHVDFQVVRRDEVMRTEVPIVLLGEAGAVHRAGRRRRAGDVLRPVRAMPGDLPAAIEVSIEDLEIGQAISVRDLGLPEGVAADVDEEALVAAAHTQRPSRPESARREPCRRPRAKRQPRPAPAARGGRVLATAFSRVVEDGAAAAARPRALVPPPR